MALRSPLQCILTCLALPFFDLGRGDALAFFWFPGAPAAAPGVASVSPAAVQTGVITTAHGSMNHVAFKVPLEKLAAYHEQLVAKGVQTTPILHHADVPAGYVPEMDESTFLSSFYFFDPDGILLEFAATVRELGDPERALQHQPVTVEA